MPTPKERQAGVPQRSDLWLHRIMEVVAGDAGHDVPWMCERNADRAHCEARAAVCWLAISLGWPPDLSLFPHTRPSAAIAARLAPLFGQARTGILSTIRKAQDWHRYDRRFRDRVETLRTRLEFPSTLPSAAPLKDSWKRMYPDINDSIPRTGSLSPIVPIPFATPATAS